MAPERSSLLSGLVALAIGCGSAPPVVEAPGTPAVHPIGLVDGALRFEGAPPASVTVVGPEGACPGTVGAAVPGGAVVEAACDGVVALAGDVPDARLVPLEAVPLRGGGTAWTGEGWNVTLVYGPDEDGAPGLPGHVQVKRGAEPRLRQNTWLHVERVALVTAGGRAWLVLESAVAGEAYALDLGAERHAWTRRADGVAATLP